jgi:hypothetical protein
VPETRRTGRFAKDEPKAKTSGGTDTAAFVEMFEHREGRLLGPMAAIQRRAFAFREAGAAGVAGELPELLGLAVAATDREIAGIPPTVELTVWILAAEAGEVVHRADEPTAMGEGVIWRRVRESAQMLRSILY